MLVDQIIPEEECDIQIKQGGYIYLLWLVEIGVGHTIFKYSCNEFQMPHKMSLVKIVGDKTSYHRGTFGYGWIDWVKCERQIEWVNAMQNFIKKKEKEMEEVLLE